jgi:hypothetical protein
MNVIKSLITNNFKKEDEGDLFSHEALDKIKTVKNFNSESRN